MWLSLHGFADIGYGVPRLKPVGPHPRPCAAAREDTVMNDFRTPMQAQLVVEALEHDIVHVEWLDQTPPVLPEGATSEPPD
jgi:hypothetical protein